MEIEERVITKEEKRIMPVWKSTIEIEREKAAKKAAKKGLEEGLEKGREEGREEVALKLLEENAGIDLIEKCTGLSEAEIDKLKKHRQAA